MICLLYCVGRWKRYSHQPLCLTGYYRVNDGSETLVLLQIPKSLAMLWCVWNLFLSLLWAWSKNSVSELPCLNLELQISAVQAKLTLKQSKTLRLTEREHSLPIAWHTGSMRRDVKPCNVHDGSWNAVTKNSNTMPYASITHTSVGPFVSQFIHKWEKLISNRQSLGNWLMLMSMIENPVPIIWSPAPESSFCEIFRWVIWDFDFLPRRVIIKASSEYHIWRTFYLRRGDISTSLFCSCFLLQCLPHDGILYSH